MVSTTWRHVFPSLFSLPSLSWNLGNKMDRLHKITLTLTHPVCGVPSWKIRLSFMPPRCRQGQPTDLKCSYWVRRDNLLTYRLNSLLRGFREYSFTLGWSSWLSFLWLPFSVSCPEMLVNPRVYLGFPALVICTNSTRMTSQAERHTQGHRHTYNIKTGGARQRCRFLKPTVQPD